MAKALLGHVGNGPDYRLVAELRRLRGRVKELETELAETRAAQTLVASVEPDLLTLVEQQPAYS